MNPRLSALAAVCLVAGILPWIVGGPLAAQLLGVPFLLLGLFVGAVAYRLRNVRPRRTTADFPQLSGGCACGGGGCCGGAAAGGESCAAPESTAGESTVGESTAAEPPVSERR